mmetsp:Transcript_2612/g.4786  ORF Transcript_2612/g.4786 Transcript_2612/m.4786 type:complete len:171 (+) Transcript_2612:443-955(+)
MMPFILAFKVESDTRTFGVVAAALMCSLSAAALAVALAPEESILNGVVLDNNPTSDTDDESNQVHDDNKHPTVSTLDFIKNNEQQEEEEEEEEVVLSMLLEYYILKHTHPPQVAGTSLLVQHWGAPPNTLSDIYSACCAASFYTSVCASHGPFGSIECMAWMYAGRRGTQ